MIALDQTVSALVCVIERVRLLLVKENAPFLQEITSVSNNLGATLRVVSKALVSLYSIEWGGESCTRRF